MEINSAPLNIESYFKSESCFLPLLARGMLRICKIGRGTSQHHDTTSTTLCIPMCGNSIISTLALNNEEGRWGWDYVVGVNVALLAGHGNHTG